MERRFNEFMDNHWPSMERRVGRIEGILYVMGLGVGAILSLLGVLVART